MENEQGSLVRRVYMAEWLKAPARSRGTQFESIDYTDF